MSKPKTAMELELEKLRAENAKLKADSKKPQVITPRVSAKGACSVYGLGRFPVTLYRSQWEQLLAHGDNIKAFLEANAGQLKSKEDVTTSPSQEV